MVEIEGIGSSGVVDINTMSAVLFVVVASCFLVMLYKLMSYWFIEVLVVLFCIGGVEVRFLFSCAFFMSMYLAIFFCLYFAAFLGKKRNS